MDLNDVLSPAHPASRHTRCDLCGQPTLRDKGMNLSYDYEGRAASFMACPTCLTTRTLLPELFEAHAAHRAAQPAKPARI